jgi:transposase-like protein
MNTRRARRALARLFEGHVGKDVVSRAWHKTRSAWQAWQERDLAGDDLVRLILDGTVVKVRLDRKATAISLLIALGIRRDGQKVVLAIKTMGGESAAAWRAVLDDLTSRGLGRPDLVIVDGGKGLEAALASLWDDVPAQRCTVGLLKNPNFREIDPDLVVCWVSRTRCWVVRSVGSRSCSSPGRCVTCCRTTTCWFGWTACSI